MFAITPRLLLRPGWPEDAPALAQAIGHHAVAANLTRVPWPYALADAEAFLARPHNPREPGCMILTRDDHRLIGGITLRAEGGTHTLGYWLTPAAWGRGYMTEAATALLAAARDGLRLPRIHATHFADNPASGRVLRKLGFRPIGPRPNLARYDNADAVEYALDFQAGAPALAA